MYGKWSRLAFAFGAITAYLPAAQTPPASQFEVASVKPNKSDDPPTANIPLGPGDVYIRNGGLFSATNLPLMMYISFAYKISGNQSQHLTLPDWVKTERFDIQARAARDPGKDGMRLMMRSLLAQRFHLAVHYEDREAPVFAFVLVKEGKTGPELRPHPDSLPCPAEQPSVATPTVVNGLPAFCNGIYPMPPTVPGCLRFGGRNVTLGFIADTFSAGTNLGRPMIDRTGLAGKFDFSLEWAQESNRAAPPGADAQPGSPGPSFQEALREQLGIKLAPRQGMLKILVVDRVEHPSAN